MKNHFLVTAMVISTIFLSGCGNTNFPSNVTKALQAEGFTNIKVEKVSEDIYHFEVGYPKISFEITNKARNQNRLLVDNKYANQSYTGVMHVNNRYFIANDTRLLIHPDWKAIDRALHKHL